MNEVGALCPSVKTAVGATGSEAVAPLWDSMLQSQLTVAASGRVVVLPVLVSYLQSSGQTKINSITLTNTELIRYDSRVEL